MKCVFRFAIFSSMLASISADALELGLMYDKFFSKAHVVSGSKFDSVNPTGLGFRVGYPLLDLKVAELGLAATYHPKAEENIVIAGHNSGKYNVEYWALGAQADWKLLVDLHAGLDVRQEKVKVEYLGINKSTNITRPWIKAGVGFGLPLPAVKPFLRLEAAMATKTESEPGSLTDAEGVSKMLAPNYQVGLYGGIRF